VQGSDWATLGLLGLLAVAVLLGRRRGMASLNSALATARAEGRAELQAELQASAVATGGSVAVHFGPEQHNGASGATFDDRVLAVIRAELAANPAYRPASLDHHNEHDRAGVSRVLLPGHARILDDADRWESVSDSARRGTAESLGDVCPVAVGGVRYRNARADDLAPQVVTDVRD